MNPLMQQLSGETLQESPETLVKNLMGILRGNDPQKVMQRELPLYFLLFQ